MRGIWIAAATVATAAALGANPSNEQIETSFQSEIRPLLETYCSRCHHSELRPAGVAFSDFDSHESVVRARPVWLRVLRVLRENEMPPAGAQPSVEERLALISWVDDAINNLDWGEFENPGSVTIPRLNRTEYNNTIRDLTGLDLRPAEDFPADGQGASGFRNDREGLFVAPMLVEKYFEAASRVVDELIETRNAKEHLSAHLEIEDFMRTETNQATTPWGLDLRNYQQTVYRYVTFPRFGRYRFRVRAWGVSPIEGEVPGVTLRVGGQIIGQSHVVNDPDLPKVYSFEANVPRGSHRVSLHWFKSKSAETNDHNRRLAAETNRLRAAAEAAGKKPPSPPVVLSLDWLEVGEHLSPRQDASLVWVAEPGAGVSGKQAAAQVLSNFAERAYRAPVEAAEIDRLVALYERAADRGEPYEQAVGLGLRAVLSSPRFLYRAELGATTPGDYRLNDYELASRMSYFLWMSMPGDKLINSAREGKLGEKEALEWEIVRMIEDPKSKAFTSTFVSQWLGFAELGTTIKPDDVEFPEFTPALNDAMIEEATIFFDRIVREDRSLLELLDADYTYVNEELATHYGMSGVVGRDFRRVELSDRRRGGVLGMGAVLTATSLPTRTSPVVRGKWVLETMLDDELPPPPPDAGELPEPGKSSKNMTVRQMFEMHRDEARCAVCHDRIDPIGFGLENFDAIGRWRDTENEQPVDATGTLPSGESFEGPVELKKILLKRQKQFARMMSGQMLKFALGRDLEYYDEPAVEKISQAVIHNNFSALTLVAEVVNSYPFRYRRSAGLQSEEIQ